MKKLEIALKVAIFVLVVAIIALFSIVVRISIISIPSKIDYEVQLNNVPGYSNLYYDSENKIVYFRPDSHYNRGYVAYYAENGFPYIYNETTNELEAINDR